jgi:hypothetical protein
MAARIAVLIAAVLPLCACVPASAGAAQAARMSARFTPERLGAPTTVSLGFQITAGGRVPSALRSMQLGYPANLGLATSGLGLASCSPSALQAVGVQVCPPDSRMGSGSALVEVPLGPEIVKENVTVALFAGPSTDGRLHVLVYVTGAAPVEAQLLFYGMLTAGHLGVLVPPIPSLPAAADVAVVQMHVTLGGHLTYYERVHGRNVAYQPPGMGLPGSCPRGGFPFVATFAFADGSGARADTTVPCPNAS